MTWQARDRDRIPALVQVRLSAQIEPTKLELGTIRGDRDLTAEINAPKRVLSTARSMSWYSGMYSN